MAKALDSKGGQLSPRIRLRVSRALEAFPYLPDEALIEVRAVSHLLGRCPASVWRDVTAGRLAQPVKIGSSTRWRVGDVRRVLVGAIRSG